MKPSLHNKLTDAQQEPPPFTFSVSNAKGKNIRYYRKNSTYTGNEQKPLKWALIQARLSTAKGDIIGHLRSGEFLMEERWIDQGLSIQKCPLVMNDSMMVTNTREKSSFQAQWKPHANDGPVQISFVVDEEKYWTQWAPKSGLLLPVSMKTNRKKNKKGENENGLKLSAPKIKVEKFSKGKQLEVKISTTESTDLVAQATTTIETNTSSAEAIIIERIEPRDSSGDNKGIFHSIKAVERPKATNFPSESQPRQLITNYCGSNPCANGGTCTNIPSLDKYDCSCSGNWTGVNCEVANFCMHHKCQNGAICLNNEDDYSCDCSQGWAGQYCDKPCPAGFCLNGGSCTVDDTDHTFCVCKLGYVGDRCETDFDDCASNPCKFGSTCIDRLGHFDCQCTPGYMGERCHRQCQDIYKSCEFWEEQDRCESMRPSTKFFDINCAVTCGQCTFDNTSVLDNMPLPPILEPLEFLIGKWLVNNTNRLRYPVDFPDATKHYYESLEFSIPNVAMFGTPSINYSAIAQSIEDPSDIQTTVGFMSLNPSFKPLSRVFRLEGSYLQETFQRKSNDSRNSDVDSITKYYFKQPVS
uniref:Uncharacterized protein n=1 Tax=Romanomermis culicivorax TaxID=13658 RepID=A0A915JFS7_ROMCU